MFAYVPLALPWAAWIERELEQTRARGDALPRRLTAVEQWQLWQEAVLQAAAGLGILAPEKLTDPVRRAVALIDDYGLQFSAEGSPEATLLLAAHADYRRRCRALNARCADSGVG